MIWVTRNYVHVDRVACPWLIQRFVDAEAEFLFVPAEDVQKVADAVGGTPFDIKGTELGHVGDQCTFNAIIKKFNLRDPALLELAEVVRAADTGSIDKTNLAVGLEAIATGIPLISFNDHDSLQKQMAVYDSLLAFFRYKRLQEQYPDEMKQMTRKERNEFFQKRYSSH
ncbi:MAG: chromate resistance protein ChrB domain-containing protein [Candidatus Heimdallarchaeota archaeon]